MLGLVVAGLIRVPLFAFAGFFLVCLDESHEVISPTDSRDLSKFTALQCTLVDAESGEIFADVLGEQAQTGDEPFGDHVAMSIYERLSCGVCSIEMPPCCNHPIA